MQYDQSATPDVLCIGSCGWDILGFADVELTPGDDVPGSLHLTPGGVASNIYRQLRDLNIPAALASVVGNDALGDALMDTVFPDRRDVSFILRSDAPTTLYLALETPTGLFGAVSATESLEKQSIELLDHASSLRGTPASRWPIAVIDSNLSTEGFQYFRNSRLFADHRIIVAAASPAKAARLRYACRDDVTIVINRAESARVCAKAGEFSNAGEAAHALHDYGFARAIVTDGPNHAADVCADWSVSARPGKGQPRNWTGAGDRFLAHHIAYDAVLDDPELVLMRACDRASS